MQSRPEEASTHRSVTTHASDVLPMDNCKKTPRTEKPTVGSNIGRRENPVSLEWIVRPVIAVGKTQRSRRTQQAAILRLKLTYICFLCLMAYTSDLLGPKIEWISRTRRGTIRMSSLVILAA